MKSRYKTIGILIMAGAVLVSWDIAVAKTKFPATR